jgi:hypothetical protein
MLWFRSIVSCKTGQHQDLKGVHVRSKNLKNFILLTLCTDIMSAWQPCGGYQRLNTISNL